jgi:BACON domain-containing protein
VGVTSGRDYWIAVLAPPGAGTLAFRDAVATANGRAETSASASLSSLPSTWATGSSFKDGPLSAYGSAAGGTAAPILAVSPASLSFSATQGAAAPAAKSLSVANTGGGALSWSAADDAAWLTESPLTGTAPGTVTVTPSIAGLTAGTYTGKVTVTASGATGSPAGVPVTLTVSAPPPPGVTTLLGAQTVQPQTDYNLNGTAEAFQITTAAAGTLSALNFYLDASSNAAKVVAGIYADNGGHPGTLLAQGSTSTPAAGAWNKLTLAPTAIATGKSYWVAILGAGSGTARFRDKPQGCHSETSSQSTLTALPSAWSTGGSYTDCPLSAYGTS